MTPTLRKLYHRRGKHLDCIAEIDKKIAELTPENRNLVVYSDGGRVQNTSGMREKIESEEFYELMQRYRSAPLIPQSHVLEKFEDVKNWIVDKFHLRERV